MDEPLVTLTATEATALEAMLDRLIPADENGPGAVEARVLRFIDRGLQADLAPLRETYAENLAALDTWARAGCGKPFAKLDPVQQDTVLSALETGEASGFAPSPQAFFDLVRVHAIHGMFSDPSHGGNAERAGWKLLGFPGPKGVFTAADQALDVDVPPLGVDDGA